MTPIGKKVYKAEDGSIRYDGPAWADLSPEERTERIKECLAIEYCSPKRLAEILRNLTSRSRPNTTGVKKHIERYKIPYATVKLTPPRGVRLIGGLIVGQKIPSKDYEEHIRARAASGKAIVAAMSQDDSSEDYFEKLKKQKGFCVAIRSDGEYCGKETGDPNIPQCAGHRPDKFGKSKPDFRGKIWMRLKT
jgi:hypothetical protein